VIEAELAHVVPPSAAQSLARVTAATAHEYTTTDGVLQAGMAEAIRIYRSPVIPSAGFVHGFPERTGGVSTGPRASLNLGARWGDDAELVAENRRRVAEHAGYDPDQLQVTKHVHGTGVWRVGEPLPDPPEFDGLVCDRLGPVLGAFAADCIPMVFADPVARICGACHAGWRGTVGGVARNVVARMAELGSVARDVRVALGPSIGPCCFEVGPEVVAKFRAVFGDVPHLVVAGPRKDHVDLRVASRVALERAGVPADQIDASPPCTRCEPDRFFSYRRDGRDGGVHMGFIGLTGS
jgi:polyphenol oxidase